MSKEQDLLKRSASEIRSLRQQNQLMRARLDMFDNMMLVLNVQVPQYGMTSSLDIAWEIDKHIEAEERAVKSSNQ